MTVPVRIHRSITREVTVDVTVDVPIDIDLGDFETADLVKELRARGEWPDTESVMEMIDDMRTSLRLSDLAEVKYLLDRLSDPKWQSMRSAQSAYDCVRPPRKVAA
jgi:hypothetical protein